MIIYTFIIPRPWVKAEKTVKFTKPNRRGKEKATDRDGGFGRTRLGETLPGFDFFVATHYRTENPE